MIKKNNKAVSQILIQWREEDIPEATWEDYHIFVEKFLSFNFEYEVGFQEGGLTMDLVEKQLEGRSKARQGAAQEITRIGSIIEADILIWK